MTQLKSIVIAYAILPVVVSLSIADELLVQTGKTTSWKYSTDKSAADWNHTDYDASQWSAGPAPLGYGRKGLTTAFEKSDAKRPVTTYLRTKFDVADVQQAEHVVMYVRADDGFVAYLNGREVKRWNLPDGDIHDDTNAVIGIDGINESFMMRFVLPPDRLVGGQNALAIEVHQAADSDDDMIWDAGLTCLAGFDPLSPVLKADARQASEAYHQQHYVGPQMTVPDGYLDGGRGMRIDENGQAASRREIVHVDRSRDIELQKHLAYARSDELRQLNSIDRATRIARYVYQAMSPSDGNRTSVMRSSYLAQLYSSQEILLGDVTRLCGAGVCRHRTLLFKIMADEAGLKTAIVRGNYRSGLFRIGGHAWNELFLEDGSKVIVDVMNPQPDYYFPSVNERSVRGYLTVRNKRWYPADKATESKDESKSDATVD